MDPLDESIGFRLYVGLFSAGISTIISTKQFQIVTDYRPTFRIIAL